MTTDELSFERMEMSAEFGLPDAYIAQSGALLIVVVQKAFGWSWVLKYKSGPKAGSTYQRGWVPTTTKWAREWAMKKAGHWAGMHRGT
jgi:hypothetical protein